MDFKLKHNILLSVDDEYYMNDEGSNSKLNITSSEKNLGVWITSKLDFTLQCDKASAKAMQSLGLIKRTFTKARPDLALK